jgi:sugar/nucleoside kinase (ribokinase family)
MNKRPFRVNFDNLDEMRSEDLVESNVLINVLKIEVPKAINKAIKEKKTYATVFEINSFGVFVEIHKKDWISALNSCVALHIKDEEYELCGELTKTLETLIKK